MTDREDVLQEDVILDVVGLWLARGCLRRRRRRGWRSVSLEVELHEAQLLWREARGAVAHYFFAAPVLVDEEAASHSAGWGRRLRLEGFVGATRCAAVVHAPP